MTTSPKLLPWLARKAGLSQEKAEALWRDTFAEESNSLPRTMDPDGFYRRVLECFRQHAALDNMRAPALARAAPASAAALRKGDQLGPGFAIA